jgi:hypothetical protein
VDHQTWSHHWKRRKRRRKRREREMAWSLVDLGETMLPVLVVQEVVCWRVNQLAAVEGLLAKLLQDACP